MGAVERRVFRYEADDFSKGLDMAAQSLVGDCPEGYHCSRIVLDSEFEGERYVRFQSASMGEAIMEAERIIERGYPVRIQLQKSPRGARTQGEVWLTDQAGEDSCDVDVWFQRREGGDRPERKAQRELPGGSPTPESDIA